MDAPFQRHRSQRIRLRPTSVDPGRKLLADHKLAWPSLEAALVGADSDGCLCADLDDRWLAWRQIGRAHLQVHAAQDLGALPPVDAWLDPDLAGPWAISQGMWMTRDRPNLPGDWWPTIGPSALSLYALRHGLKGYITGLCLSELPLETDPYPPQALLQQIIAGAIDHPLAQAYLKAGAQVLGHLRLPHGPLVMVLRHRL